MNADRRAVLEGIAYGDDPKLTATDRLRALELLRDEDDDLDAAGRWIARQLAALSDEALDRELGEYNDSGWHPPDPGADAQAADQYGAAVVDAIASEDASTRFPMTTRRIAALAERWLPALDAHRVQAEVDRQVAERVEALRAADQIAGKVVPLHAGRASDGEPRPKIEDVRAVAGEQPWAWPGPGDPVWHQDEDWD